MTGRVILLSGAKGVGKSTLAARVAAMARAAGWRVGGVLSPPELSAEGEKVGIWLEDAASGERRRLAESTRLRQGAAVETTHWSFDDAVLEWGAALIAAATPCDLLLVDELGPLELERGQGWTVAFDVLRGGGLEPRAGYRCALVVIRAPLVAALEARLAGLPVEAVVVTEANREALAAQLAARLWGAGAGEA